VDALAIVCGATGPLGRAVVAAFVARGDRVVAVARSADRLHALEKAVPGVRAEVAELANFDEVEAFWQRIDQVEATPKYLVNAIGGFRSGSAIETDPEDYRFLLDTHLGATWWSCRAAGRRMRDARGASIVNVAARSALVGGAGTAAYAVAKAAVVRLTQVMADELKDARVQVNAVLPALIETPANRASFPPERMARAVAPEAIARVITFLCSDDSLPITGAAIPVYGAY
jgi:NAD(P)-dependent dehydrogenase (short-subunit alcohol dehydrogenase family)